MYVFEWYAVVLPCECLLKIHPSFNNTEMALAPICNLTFIHLYSYSISVNSNYGNHQCLENSFENISNVYLKITPLIPIFPIICVYKLLDK